MLFNPTIWVLNIIALVSRRAWKRSCVSIDRTTFVSGTPSLHSPPCRPSGTSGEKTLPPLLPLSPPISVFQLSAGVQCLAEAPPPPTLQLPGSPPLASTTPPPAERVSTRQSRDRQPRQLGNPLSTGRCQGSPQSLSLARGFMPTVQTGIFDVSVEKRRTMLVEVRQ